MPVSRRSFLTGSAAVLAGGSLARALPSGAAGLRAGGPLAEVYGEIGVPRGRALGLSAQGPAARTATWLTTGSGEVSSLVEWGVVPPGAPPGQVRAGRYLTRIAEGSSSMAPTGRFDDDTATSTPIDGEHPVRVHRAELTGLPAGLDVCYRVGTLGAWSDVTTFRTGTDGAFRLAHVGDHGVTAASRRTTAAVAALAPDALVLTGDISYANGYQPTWDRWASQAEPMTSVVPLLPVPGNHEAKDFYGETYRSRFTTPAGGSNWYAVDLGRARLFAGTAGCFLTEKDPVTAVDLVTDELVAMERELALAAVRRAAGEIDFLVVAQHFPLYTNHDTRGPFSPQLVIAQEHILQRYQVDLVLVGHDHMYQRSHRMAYGEATGTAAGYVQVCAGAGGNGLYEFADPDGPDWGDWCAAYQREFSFAEYEIARGSLRGVVRGWADAEAQVEDENPNAVDPSLPHRVVDEFVLHRKDDALVASAAAAVPRSAVEVLAGVPEARGVVVRNHAEDCTRHHH